MVTSIRKYGGNWKRQAQVIGAIAAVYIFANGIVTGIAERDGRALVAQHLQFEPTMMVGSPVPFAFWERELLWRHNLDASAGGGSLYGDGTYSLLDGAKLRIERHHYHGDRDVYLTRNSPKNRAVVHTLRGTSKIAMQRAQRIAMTNPEFKAFLFWSRMPLVKIGRDDVVITDQRFTDPRAVDRFTVRAPLERAE